jgi:hypothetical protein
MDRGELFVLVFIGIPVALLFWSVVRWAAGLEEGG